MIDLKNIGSKQVDLLRDAYLNKKLLIVTCLLILCKKRDLIQLIGLHVFLIVREKTSQMGLATIAKEFWMEIIQMSFGEIRGKTNSLH